MVRLRRYRRSFVDILTACDTNRSRFLRLFLICLLWIVASVPIQAYTFYVNLSFPRDSYSWQDAHDPELLSEIMLVPSGGIVVYDRFIWLCAGFAMFLFFGLGKDAMSMYSDWMSALRLRILVPNGFKQRFQRRRHSLGEVLMSSSGLRKRKPVLDRWSTSYIMEAARTTEDDDVVELSVISDEPATRLSMPTRMR